MKRRVKDFLDEIQECPEALKALRYFYENMPTACDCRGFVVGIRHGGRTDIRTCRAGQKFLFASLVIRRISDRLRGNQNQKLVAKRVDPGRNSGIGPCQMRRFVAPLPISRGDAGSDFKLAEN